MGAERVAAVLDATDGGGGLKIAKVQDAIDAAIAARARAEAQVQADAEQAQREREQREAEQAEVVAGEDRKRLIQQGLERLR